MESHATHPSETLNTQDFGLSCWCPLLKRLVATGALLVPGSPLTTPDLALNTMPWKFYSGFSRTPDRAVSLGSAGPSTSAAA